MSEPLPTELLDAIVDIVALDGGEESKQDLISLCLCSKAFVPRTQMHIYREVTIYPAGDAHIGDSNSRSSPLYRGTVSLAKAIQNRPHLALHVETLKCKLTTRLENDDRTILDVTKAIALMSNIRELTLGFDPLAMNPPSSPHGMIPYGTIRSWSWNNAVVQLLRRQTLERFGLHNTISYPEAFMPLTGGTRHVRCFHSTLSQSPVASGSIQSVVNVICGAETLHITAYSNWDITGPLLTMFRCLRELTITIEAPAHTSLDELHSPLKDIHPECLTSLTHLSVRINTRLVKGRVAAGHPCGWRWSLVLARFQYLQSLKLHYHFQHFVDDDGIAGLEAGWACINNDPAHPGVCPLLTTLAVRFDLRISQDAPDADMREQAAKVFLKELPLAYRVYGASAAELLLEQVPTVEFSFEGFTAIGPLIQESFS